MSDEKFTSGDEIDDLRARMSAAAKLLRAVLASYPQRDIEAALEKLDPDSVGAPVAPTRASGDPRAVGCLMTGHNFRPGESWCSICGSHRAAIDGAWNAGIEAAAMLFWPPNQGPYFATKQDAVDAIRALKRSLHPKTCCDLYGPPVPSAVSAELVHPATPAGRIVCTSKRSTSEKAP